MRELYAVMSRLGLAPETYSQGDLSSESPIDGSRLGLIATTNVSNMDALLGRAQQAFLDWRLVPAPQRGELVRLLAEQLRLHKNPLAQLVSLEVGKIISEAQGEVQEMIDICDFAVGLSRQLHGLTIASERPQHRMMECWHPLGVVGVITAFNFPVAVWAWNAALALVCGNAVIWKPSEQSPLCALAVDAIFQQALARFRAAGYSVPAHLAQVAQGGRDQGDFLARDSRIALLSATGSSAMGRAIAPVVAQRFGRCLLELGGNNAIIVAPSAPIDLALRAVTFSAVGTSGQRCTTARRLIIQRDRYDEFIEKLRTIYGSLAAQGRIGSPLEPSTLLGPLIDGTAFEQMQAAIARARSEGAQVFGGQRVLQEHFPQAWYVTPALVELEQQADFVHHEVFAPLLYVMPYDELEQAIAMNNAVPQGLSSSLFTRDLQEAEWFLSAHGSDCGIANINIGTSGAEIGGAFGGEKETGGGRESGSDAWKNYMRRSTNTINYSSELPLAQGVSFDV
ncbi:MAG: aldehyde dehydrogenase family protein [Burkholderiales bacterium]